MAKTFIHCISHERVKLVKIEEKCHPIDGTRIVRFKGLGPEAQMSEQQFFNFFVEEGKVPWLTSGPCAVEASEDQKKQPWPPSRLRSDRSS